MWVFVLYCLVIPLSLNSLSKPQLSSLHFYKIFFITIITYIHCNHNTQLNSLLANQIIAKSVTNTPLKRRFYQPLYTYLPIDYLIRENIFNVMYRLEIEYLMQIHYVEQVFALVQVFRPRRIFSRVNEFSDKNPLRYISII